MIDSKDLNDVSPDNDTRLIMDDLPVDEREEFEDYMKRLDEEFRQWQAQVCEKAKTWYLSHFTINRHHRVIQEREIEFASVVASQKPSTVSKIVPSQFSRYPIS